MDNAGLGENKGALRAGFDADVVVVVVVAGDSMADITALERVRAVFLRGQPV